MNSKRPELIVICALLAMVLLTDCNGSTRETTTENSRSREVAVLEQFYNPPAPKRLPGNYSTAIEPRLWNEYLIRLTHGSKWKPNDARFALELNQAGILCFANRKDSQAEQTFRRALEIEKSCTQDFWTDGDWALMKLKMLNDEYIFDLVDVSPARLTHSERMQGFKHNLKLVVSSFDYQKDEPEDQL